MRLGHPDRREVRADAERGGIREVEERVISDNYFYRLTTTRITGPTAVRTACATVDPRGGRTGAGALGRAPHGHRTGRFAC